MLTLDALDADVQRLVDEATPDLLPMLLKIFLKDDRPGLVTCVRHSHHLFPYVRAQIDLTRAKRHYYRWSDVHWPGPCHGGVVHEDPTEAAYHRALRIRDEVRQTYRSTPCTCWVQHR